MAEVYADPEERQQVLAELSRNGRIDARQLSLRARDGSLRWVSLSVRAVPGDPAAMSLGVYATAERVAELRNLWGLDQSMVVQYGIFLKQLLKGDFGYSYFYGRPAIELVFARLIPELFLIAYAIVLTIFISVPLAVWAALRRSGAAEAVLPRTGRAIKAVSSGARTQQ